MVPTSSNPPCRTMHPPDRRVSLGFGKPADVSKETPSHGRELDIRTVFEQGGRPRAGPVDDGEMHLLPARRDAAARSFPCASTEAPRRSRRTSSSR